MVVVLVATRLEDLVLHGSVTVGDGRRGSGGLGVTGVEVVGQAVLVLSVLAC